MPLPMYQEQKKSPQEQKKEVTPLSQIKHIVGVAAGKGGVGKSSVAVNLALSLKQQGFAVGILDTDIYGPSVRKMLPEDQLPLEKDQKIQPAVCGGIRMISMAYFRHDNVASVVRAPIANGLITQFIKQVEWGALDFLIIDFPPGTGDIQLTLAQQANLSGVVIVTTPQEIALLDVRKTMNMFNQLKVPIIGVIENMSYYRYPKTGEKIHMFGKDGGKMLARDSGLPFLGELPIDPDLCQCGDKGESIFLKHAESEIAKSFLAIAQQVETHLEHMRLGSQDRLQSFQLVWREMA